MKLHMLSSKLTTRVVQLTLEPAGSADEIFLTKLSEALKSGGKVHVEMPNSRVFGYENGKYPDESEGNEP